MGIRQTSLIILLAPGTLVQTNPSLKIFEPSAPTLSESTQRLPMKEGKVCYSSAHTHTPTPNCTSVHPQVVLDHETRYWNYSLRTVEIPGFGPFFLTFVRNIIV